MTEYGQAAATADQSALAVPSILASFAGRMVDVDTHEMIPVQLWKDHFGAVTEGASDVILHSSVNQSSPALLKSDPASLRDDQAINAKTVWEMKGPEAPAAIDMSRRLEVMDLTGISRQMIFPGSVGIIGACLLGYAPGYGFLSNYKGDRKAYGKSLIDASNLWAVRTAHISDRLRPVGLVAGDTVYELNECARSLLDQGVRAVWLPNSVLPGGVSPAHPDLDPFWQMLAEANVAVTTHIGGESGFVATEVWAQAPAFDGFKFGLEFNLSPWHLSIQHLPTQNFLTTMVLGGVFERHPTLRFGAIEVGAYWIGPMAQALDLWHLNGQKMAPINAPRLPRLPSEYIARNVRVSAFPFEPVDSYIDQFGLTDVYCYASDYPHFEGGKYSMNSFAARLERFGMGVMENFFVNNGAFLLAD